MNRRQFISGIGWLLSAWLAGCGLKFADSGDSMELVRPVPASVSPYDRASL
jgi:hypothetical protein